MPVEDRLADLKTSSIESVSFRRASEAVIPRNVEPTSEQVERATGALVPFVQTWNLPLNPEDLAEIAYAALMHHDSHASWEEILAAVRAQIDDHRQQTESLYDAMDETE